MNVATAIVTLLLAFGAYVYHLRSEAAKSHAEFVQAVEKAKEHQRRYPDHPMNKAVRDFADAAREMP